MQTVRSQLCRKLLLLVICGGMMIPPAAAQAKYTITPFTPRDGLVSADIISLFQDSKSYLWVGHAAGVSRYNGYQFENFLFTSDQQVGKTYCIAEDSMQNIWVGAENGLFVFRNGQLHSVSFNKLQRPVYAIEFDSKNGLWIGSSEGPSYFAKQQWQQVFSSYQLPLLAQVLPVWKQYFGQVRQVPYISAGKDGSVYFGDGYAVFKYYQNQVLPVWKALGGFDPLKNIIAINKDSVFICSSYGGLQAIENTVYRRSRAKLGTSNSLIKKNGKYFYYSLVGIYEMDARTLDVQQLFAFPSTQWEWGSALLMDNESNFWVGTHEQLCYARKNYFTIISQPALYGFDELYTVKRLRDGSLVCGGNRGKLFRRNQDSAAFYKSMELFPLAAVTDIYEEPDGELWFSSSYQGITLAGKNGQRRFTVDDGLRDNTNFRLFKSIHGGLYACGDRGVTNILKDQSGKVKFLNYAFYTGSTDYAIVYCGIDKPSGGLLFGSNRGLLELKDTALVPARIKNSRRSNYNITDMRSDAHGNIWISTVGDGILICSFDHDSLRLDRQLTDKDGLSSLVWLQLLVDKDDRIWAAGYNGLTRIEHSGHKQYFIAEYGRMHGFIPQLFHTIKMMQDSSGIIWAATSSGLMKFDPGALGQTVFPSLQLNSITITDEASGQAADSTLTTGNVEGPLRLPYRSNSIAFGFTGIYFSDPASVIYAYRLLGQDSSWTLAANNRGTSFRHLRPGRYRFEVKAAAGTNRWSNTAGFSFIILPPFWQRWWFIVLCALAALSILFVLVKLYIGHIQRREEEKTKVQQLISERQQAQLEALQNEQKATEARLQSMRLQMNPHFLFNALNSIQQMILAGDEAVATRCLSKFSKLLRLILIHSDKEKVTLREELETLRLYVDLESFRFKDRFEYFVTCDNAIDQDDMRIPTLLIQPFVENAIWHGLMHKEGARRLQVHFTEERDTLVCIIEDNGIGRQASKTIRESSIHEHKHTGKGIVVATERLKIFGKQSANGSDLEIIDLKDKQGNPAGTRVVVRFPA